MEHNEKLWCGIDCSKLEHQVYVDSWSKSRAFINSPSGVRKLASTLKLSGVDQVVIEATGGYELSLAEALEDASVTYSIVNPTRAKAFGFSMGNMAKTDSIDAKVLMEYGQSKQPKPSKLPNELERRIRTLLSRRAQLVKMQMAELNHLKNPVFGETLKKQIKSILDPIKKQIKEIEKEIKKLIASDTVHQNNYKLLNTIPGIGEITAVAMLVYLSELGTMSRKQIATLVGVAPFNNDSGTSLKGKRKIRGGRKEVRDLLYMCALTAIRSNPIVRSHYRNLRSRNKPAKLARIACARKLLTSANAIIRDQLPWAPRKFTLSKDDRETKTIK